MKLVLANIDYKTHITDEGEQLQAGLETAGWTLAGHGYGDGCRHVSTLLARYQPERIFVQDCRDWRHESRGCFNPAVHFSGWEELRHRPAGCKVFTVCKDAATSIEVQWDFARAIRADGLAIYYHPDSVHAVAPWVRDYPQVRIYHTIQRELCQSVNWTSPRIRGIVTGAMNGRVYPLRKLAYDHQARLGLDVRFHPGYHNRGCCSHGYLKLLGQYRVHLACSSRYGFALRKIIESVAMGTTPITDLPAYDRLPGIDEALVRVRPGVTVDELQHVINLADEGWNLADRRRWAMQAWETYDFRPAGQQLSEALCRI